MNRQRYRYTQLRIEDDDDIENDESSPSCISRTRIVILMIHFVLSYFAIVLLLCYFFGKLDQENIPIKAGFKIFICYFYASICWNAVDICFHITYSYNHNLSNREYRSFKRWSGYFKYFLTVDFVMCATIIYYNRFPGPSGDNCSTLCVMCCNILGTLFWLPMYRFSSLLVTWLGLKDFQEVMRRNNVV